MTILFLPDTYDTSARSLVKPKIEEWTLLCCFPLRNNAGTLGLFYLSVPTALINLVKSKFACSQLVKKLSVVTNLPVPYR